MLKLIHIIGLILARSPEVIPRSVAACLGDLIYFLPTKRRGALLRNLHHAFPEMSERERRSIGRTSCRRTIEMGLLVLVSPHFSRDDLRRRFQIEPSMLREISKNNEAPRSGTAIAPHLCLMESLSFLPALTDEPLPEIAAIYRPLNQPVIDQWVLATRQRFGFKLLSRKEGFTDAIHLLRGKNVVGILFDQNAGDAGVLSTFMGRVCSTTELPGLLASRLHTEFLAVWTERTGFWRGIFRMEFLDRPTDAEESIMISNRWFEEKMRSEPKFRTDWLWLHERWRTQNQPEKRFKLKLRRTALDEEIRWRGWDELPRKTKLFVRMPNWLGDVIMALPLLRALREGRPDMEITLLARGHLTPLLERLPFVDRIVSLPPKGNSGQRAFLAKMRLEYPDTHVLFTNSFRGDREAKRMGAPQRFGILRPGKPRPMLTHAWEMPADLDESTVHQTELWQRFLAHFGLEKKPDFSPLKAVDLGIEMNPPSGTIGLICGTENDPAKRWPVARWRELIEAMPEATFALFGTANDRVITEQVADGFPPERVANRAGETSLVDFAAEVAACRALVSNDTGGMHLANALGVPVLVVFGPTNPVRTGPCFDAPKALIQPEGCAPTGGGDISVVTAERVAAELNSLLEAPAP